jgi:acyl-CoA synthetase (AMP-forming)/AMP-acid ligase II
MVIKSRFSVGIPNCSIQKWIFGSCSDPLPDRKAWIDADNPTARYLTISSGRLLAKRIAVGLLEHGIQPGDRVLVLSGNSVVFPAVILGIWMAGGIFTAANPSYVARELAYQLKDSGATAMIATSTSWDVAVQAAGMVGMDPEDMFVLDDTIPGLDETERVTVAGTQHWTKLLASKEKGEAFVWEEPADSKTVTCTLNYSSGTVRLSTHHNQMAASHR